MQIFIELFSAPSAGFGAASGTNLKSKFAKCMNVEKKELLLFAHWYYQNVCLWLCLATHALFRPFSAEKPREACFDPGNIMNGSRTGYDYKLGSQVSYNCHHGYTIVGEDTITCVMGNDGKPVWDRALPSCKGKRQILKFLFYIFFEAAQRIFCSFYSFRPLLLFYPLFCSSIMNFLNHLVTSTMMSAVPLWASFIIVEYSGKWWLGQESIVALDGFSS